MYGPCIIIIPQCAMRAPRSIRCILDEFPYERHLGNKALAYSIV